MHYAEGSLSAQLISMVENLGAHNYHPLEVVLSEGKGEWVWDVEGNKYLDMLSAYSAVNQGHCHPRLKEALLAQAQKITLTSRAFYSDQLSYWCKKITDFAGMEMVLPMNTGAEAVETAIKAARKWGYIVKKVPKNSAEILVCSNNFHGRTTTIVGFSSESKYQDNFGPFTPGFKTVEHGDIEGFRKAITPNTVAFLFEPVQGEAGVILPPPGYLEACQEICRKNNVLFVADEIQTGLCRTGKKFAFEHYSCQPDLLILGKALGGGFLPISAVLGRKEILGLFEPGDHGSTFGGNPLACAVSIEALNILEDENLAQRAQELGEKFRSSLRSLPSEIVSEVRGIGLLNAIEVRADAGVARNYSTELRKRGLLAKETRSTTVRFAPPLVITDEAMDWAIATIREVFSQPRNAI